MRKEMADEEIKEIIRDLCKVADLGLDEERIQLVVPAFRAQLEWVDTLNTFELALEAEPTPIFQLRKWRST